MDMEENSKPETRTDSTEQAEKKMYRLPDDYVMMNLFMGLAVAGELQEVDEVAAGARSNMVEDGMVRFYARVRAEWLAKGYVEVEQGYWDNELMKGGNFFYYPGDDYPNEPYLL